MCLLHCIQRVLIRSQELGDEKIQLASQMVEMLENRSRQVDSLAELLETRHEPQESMTATTISSVIPSKKREAEKRREASLGSIERLSGANMRSRCQKNNHIDTRENVSTVHHDEGTSGIVREKRNKTSKIKKRSKAKADREPSPTDLPIDPNETTYCLCEQVSFGEMIGCDNGECPIEWFHFSCVGLNYKPKGKWYCPNSIRGHRENHGQSFGKSKNGEGI
ncbi:inhibitor of growth protein 1-like [Sinocyclocheilus anshuiensis]|nr:PREDICTED: inhibitor of growth protein 1-like [Sinocyclocheilus anshuiensis]